VQAIGRRPEMQFLGGADEGPHQGEVKVHPISLFTTTSGCQSEPEDVDFPAERDLTR